MLLLSFSSQSQTLTLSDDAAISILTIGPGKYLYDKFGHSAFRIEDPKTGLDLVFNYGVYDFDTPNFYSKFAQGKLLYKLAVSPYEPFFNSYVAQDRWVKEQVLNLTYSQKLAIFNFLIENTQPENQYYQYDFFYDNCATKIRDVLKRSLGEKLQYNDAFVDRPYTFRELIQKNVHWNTWGSLGMDVAIGAVVDQPASAWEYQFLPEYVFEAAATATIAIDGETQPLVATTSALYETETPPARGQFLVSPLALFGLLAAVLLGITYRDYRKERRTRLLDSLIFFTTGLIGVVLSLLWFATDHQSTANNYNLLWAFPFSLLFTYTISQSYPKSWVRRYIIFLVLLLLLLCIHWITGVQSFPPALLPLLVALAVRYLFIIYFLKKQRPDVSEEVRP